MSGDIKYSVEVAFLTSGKLDAPAASLGKNLSSVASNFGGQMQNALGNVSSFFAADLASRTVASIGHHLANGFGEAVKSAFAFNEEMENTKIQIAAISNANGLVPNMNKGLEQSQGLISLMRQHAADLPGEFKDLAGILATVATAGAGAGMDMNQIEGMSAKIMSAAATLRIPMNVAGREAAMILEGGARRQMPMFNRLQLGAPVEFNKLSQEERLSKFMKALNALAPATREYADSWTAVKTNVHDALERIKGYTGEPLYASFKKVGNQILGWFKGNDQSIREFTGALGAEISNAFEHGIATIQHWYPIIKNFANSLYEHLHHAWYRLEPYMERLLKRLENFMKDPQAVDKLIHVAKILGELKLASMVAGPALSGLGSTLGKGGMGAAALGMKGGVGAAAAEGLTSAVAALGGMGVVAPVGAAALLAVVGAVMALTDSSYVFHDTAVGHASSIVTHMQNTGQNISNAFDNVSLHLKPLLETFGTAFLISLDSAAWQLQKVTGLFAGLNKVMDSLAKHLVKLGVKIGDNLPGYIDKGLGVLGLTGAKNRAGRLLDNALGAVGLGGLHFGGPKLGKDVVEKVERTMDVPGPKALDPMDWLKHKKPPEINNHFHAGAITIKVEPNQDPSRIAKRTFDYIKDVARHPRVAGLTGAPSFTRT